MTSSSEYRPADPRLPSPWYSTEANPPYSALSRTAGALSVGRAGVALLAGHRVGAEIHARLPRRRPAGARNPFMAFLQSPLATRGETRRGTPQSASDLDLLWQPVRDSNPCRHLERVSRAVRPVLSDDVAWSSSRDDSTRRAVSCRPVLANVVEFSTDSLAKSLASCRHTLPPSVPPHSWPAMSVSRRLVCAFGAPGALRPLPCLHPRTPRRAVTEPHVAVVLRGCARWVADEVLAIASTNRWITDFSATSAS